MSSPTGSSTRLPLTTRSLHWCTDCCAWFPLLLGQGSCELAAEVGDVCDNAPRDQVERRLGGTEHAAEEYPQVASNGSPPSAGVLTGVVQTPVRRRSRRQAGDVVAADSAPGPTLIVTTGLPFKVSLDPAGTMEVRLIA